MGKAGNLGNEQMGNAGNEAGKSGNSLIYPIFFMEVMLMSLLNAVFNDSTLAELAEYYLNRVIKSIYHNHAILIKFTLKYCIYKNCFIA
jgi:hypothetical protein